MDTQTVADMTDEELGRRISKEFFDRGLAGPVEERMTRLQREIRDGRTFTSIGRGLDRYLGQGEEQTEPAGKVGE